MRPDLDDAEVKAIQEVIVATGALDALEAHIAELAVEPPSPPSTRSTSLPRPRCRLTELAGFVVARVL